MHKENKETSTSFVSKTEEYKSEEVTKVLILQILKLVGTAQNILRDTDKRNT